MDTATTEIYPYYHTLSLRDALPIWSSTRSCTRRRGSRTFGTGRDAPAYRGDYGRSAPADRPPDPPLLRVAAHAGRSEEHTSELQSLMRISYAVFCLKKKKKQTIHIYTHQQNVYKKPTKHNQH